MKLRISSLDHYGYNGRDHYAKDSDIGSMVLVLGADVQLFDTDGDYLSPALDGGIAADPVLANMEDGANLVAMFTCLTADGRTVELMEHEVELFDEPDIAAIVDGELLRIKSQTTQSEWFALREVIKQSLQNALATYVKQLKGSVK